jgi:hypothetical protein
MMPFEWDVRVSSKDHTVAAPTSSPTRQATVSYTTMRDVTLIGASGDQVTKRNRLRAKAPSGVVRSCGAGACTVGDTTDSDPAALPGWPCGKGSATEARVDQHEGWQYTFRPVLAWRSVWTAAWDSVAARRRRAPCAEVGARQYQQPPIEERPSVLHDRP